MQKRKILITSALPYVNNIPHLGTLIGCVLSADVFYKYCKISEYDTLYICGTDEYGTTTETRAIQENMSPKELCDKYYKIHKEIYEWFEIDFSHFGRTSDPAHTEIVQNIFLKLYQNGYIEKDTLIQPYCEQDKLFLADRYVEGVCPHCKYERAKGDQCENCGKLLNPNELVSPKCTICSATPAFKETKHLFLNLEKLKKELENWINKAPKDGNWSNNALSLTKGWLEQGLLKRCITRDLKWGIPVPLEDYKDKVFYVWFDAPIGYISITASKFDNWQQWWKNPEEVELFQFMGKDNIPFHTIIFPATLLGTKENWTMLKTISSTEYLNYEDLKFSKSRGTGVFGDQVRDTGIDPDIYRFYLLRNRPEKNDTQFFWTDFMEKVNGELIDNYANLVNRVLQFINRFFDNIVPEFNKKNSIYSQIDFEKNIKETVSLFEEIELKKALLKILEISSLGNKFFQDNEPWVLIKKDKEKAKDIIGSLACFVKDISILLYPYIPSAVKKVFDILNLKEDDILIKNIGKNELLINRSIKKAEILFKKLEKETIESFREKFSGQQKDDSTTDFNKLNIKVGKIIEIKRHPKADKLYIEKVDLGNNEIRQIVSGLVPYYKEEELLDKKIAVVCNLKPAVLRGEKSEGMLLAAETEDRGIVEVIFPEGEVGENLLIEGAKPSSAEISIDDFFSTPLTVENFEIKFKGKAVAVNSKIVKVNKVKDGKVR